MISITSLSQTAWAQTKAVDPGAATGSGDPRSFAPKVNTKLLSPGALIRDCGNCPEMVVIPGGSFVMGSNVQDANLPEKPVWMKNSHPGKARSTQCAFQLLPLDAKL